MITKSLYQWTFYHLFHCLDKWINASLLSLVLMKKREHISVLVKDMQWILSWTGWPERCNCTLNTCFCWGAERWHSQGQSWLLLISNKYKTDLPPLLLFSAKKRTQKEMLRQQQIVYILWNIPAVDRYSPSPKRL